MGKKKDLLRAIEPFVSDRMLEQLADRPNDTQVRVEVAGRNGYLLELTLGQLRTLQAALKAYSKTEVIEIDGSVTAPTIVINAISQNTGDFPMKRGGVG